MDKGEIGPRSLPLREGTICHLPSIIFLPPSIILALRGHVTGPEASCTPPTLFVSAETVSHLYSVKNLSTPEQAHPVRKIRL